MHTRFRSPLSLCAWGLWGLALVGPGAGAQTVPEGVEHATQVLGNAWDMDSSADVFPLLWTHNLSAATVANGVMTGTARDTDPHFWLQFPRIPSAIQPANLAQPAIDTAKYTHLSFMMWLPDSVVAGSRNGRLVWHRGGSTVQAFDSAYSESSLFPVYPGWHVYHFDLASLVPASGGAWTGSIEGLRIDPCLGCQVEFKLDWARVYQHSDTAAAVSLPTGKTHLVADIVPTGETSPQWIALPGASGKVSVARLPAGQYRVAPITDGDYALSHRGKPWNFTTQTDLQWSGIGGFASPQVGTSGFTGTTNGADPVVWLDMPSQSPIDASKYRYLALDMTLSQVPAQESGALVWWETIGSGIFPSAFTPVQAGRATYHIDLGESAQWRGLVKALRIDPLNGPHAGSGVRVTLHGVRLTRTRGFEEAVTYNSQPLVINARPRVQILSPAFDTGDDYALVEQGKAWALLADQVKQPQLSNLSGWEYVTSIPGLAVTGQFFHATSQPAASGQTEGDPHAFLAYQENQHPIDANAYRFLGFDLHVPMDATQQSELTHGAVARIAWKENDTDVGVTSDDIVLMPGLQRYWFDMSQVVYEPASPRQWGGSVRYLRVDPLEFPESRHFYLGASQLRSLPSAKWVVPVALQLNDPEGDALSVTVRAGTTVLAQAQGLGNGVHQVLASVAALPVGEHTLSVEVSDGRSTLVRQAEVPIRKLSLADAMPTHQVKAADRIFNWAESLLASTLGPGTASDGNHACLQAIPGAYGRFYASSGICLLTVDGQVLFTSQGALNLVGSTAQLLSQAAAAGH